MNLAEIWRLENIFDQGELAQLEEGLQEAGEAQKNLWKILLHYHLKEYSAVLQLASEGLQQNPDLEQTIFIFQFAISATEVIYDLPLRNQWLQRLKNDSAFFQNPYAVYLQAYSDATTAFFNGSLRESEVFYTQALHQAVKLSYLRGQMRCLFHLGLVNVEIGRQQKSRAMFLQAKDIGLRLNAMRFLKRIEAQIQSSPYLSPGLEVESLLMQRKWLAARRLVLLLERQRRVDGLNRESENTYIYFYLLALGFEKPKLAEIARQSILDPVLRERALELKQRIFGLSTAEASEIAYLRLAINKLNESGTLSVQDIWDEEVKSLVTLLMSAPEISKNDLCTKLWNYEYDPVAHDSRIYRLVGRARKILGNPELIENRYGSYRLNPLYQASVSSSAVS